MLSEANSKALKPNYDITLAGPGIVMALALRIHRFIRQVDLRLCISIAASKKNNAIAIKNLSSSIILKYMKYTWNTYMYLRQRGSKVFWWGGAQKFLFRYIVIAESWTCRRQVFLKRHHLKKVVYQGIATIILRSGCRKENFRLEYSVILPCPRQPINCICTNTA